MNNGIKYLSDQVVPCPSIQTIIWNSNSNYNDFPECENRVFVWYNDNPVKREPPKKKKKPFIPPLTRKEKRAIERKANG